jgi:hypothetical protein
MKKNWLLIVGGVLLIIAALLVINSARPNPPQTIVETPSHEHSTPVASEKDRIPAHYEQAPSVKSLGPTLPPEQFFGSAREAYKVVRQIPQTIAQLPCYCHCDRGMGHKSLYSCFEDDHASHCAVCVNEALLAYRLEKQEKLTPAQIRDRIIKEYSQ